MDDKDEFHFSEHSLCFVWCLRDLGLIRCFIFEKYIWGSEARLEQCYIVHRSQINSFTFGWKFGGLVILVGKLKLLGRRNFGFSRDF